MSSGLTTAPGPPVLGAAFPRSDHASSSNLTPSKLSAQTRFKEDLPSEGNAVVVSSPILQQQHQIASSVQLKVHPATRDTFGDPLRSSQLPTQAPRSSQPLNQPLQPSVQPASLPSQPAQYPTQPKHYTVQPMPIHPAPATSSPSAVTSALSAPVHLPHPSHQAKDYPAVGDAFTFTEPSKSLVPAPAHTTLVQEYDAILTKDREEEEAEERDREETEREQRKQRIVYGMDNEDLMSLLRTFDKQIQQVHICPPPFDSRIPGGLDLQPCPNEAFSVDKFRSALERFFASAGIGIIRVFEEVQRVRTWESRTRTFVVLSAYAYAWWCNLIMTGLLLYLSALIFFPSFRGFCFDPVLDDAEALGIPAKKGQPWGPAAAEQKASMFADGLINVIKAVVVPGAAPKGGTKQMQRLQQKIEGSNDDDDDADEDDDDEKKSKKDKAIENFALPGMKIIAGLADKWERVACALNPTPPFQLHPKRIDVFCYLLAGPLLISTFVPERMFSRAFGIIFGFIFFGQPVMDYTLAELNKIEPDWLERLILENNILATTPTNSQLVLRLLRQGEHKQQPLPVPFTELKDKVEPDGEEEDDDLSDDETLHDGEAHDADHDKEQHHTEDSESAKHKKGERRKNLKSGARAKVRKLWDKTGRAKEEGFALLSGHKKVDWEGKAKNAMDKLHIDEDTKPAKLITRVLPSAPDDSPDSPARFYVYHPKHGPGHIIIHPPVPADSSQGTESIPARLTFTTMRKSAPDENAVLDTDDKDSSAANSKNLTIWINDVVGLKKEGKGLVKRILTSFLLDADGAGGTGLEMKIVRRDGSGPGRLADGNSDDVLGGGAGDCGADRGMDGLKSVMVDGRIETVGFNGIVRRNELFDRLIALGDQKWEMH